MPESFQMNGYQTAMFGKWHLGHSQKFFIPIKEDLIIFMAIFIQRLVISHSLIKVELISKNGVTINDQGYSTFLLQEVSNWINSRDKERPFLCMSLS